MEDFRDKIIKDAYMTTKLMNMVRRGELRLDHPLQREAGQWNNVTRDGLIATIIKDEDIDSLKICEQIGKNDVALWLIDGKQRFTTMQMFKFGAFKLGKSIEFPIVKYKVIKKDTQGNLLKNDDGELISHVAECDLRGKGYDDLPEELKEMFDNYKVNVVKHLDCSDDEIGYHMRRYNRQTSLNTSQDCVTFMDNTAKYVKDISMNSKFFIDCGVYTENEMKKGIADRVVIESVMSIFHLNDWKKNSKKMGFYINDKSNKEEFMTLKSELERLERVIDNPIDLFNSKNTFIWLALFHKFCQLGVSDNKFVNFLVEFGKTLHSKSVNGVTFDCIDGNKSTKDKKVIEDKITLLENLMLNYLHLNPSQETTTLDFVQQNVREDVVQEDIDLCEEMLDDLTLNVDNNSKLLEKQNHNSLIALIQYSNNNEIDLDDWIANYFSRNSNYIMNQKQNFEKMRDDLNNYISKKENIYM